MLHSMAMKLLHVHNLEILYLFHGVKVPPGVIWGHMGQKAISVQNAVFYPYLKIP